MIRLIPSAPAASHALAIDTSNPLGLLPELMYAGGGQIEMSPISMNIDMNTGLGLTPEQAYDPYSAYKIVITYRDGSTYTVVEHEYPDVYACDEYTDNTSYSCGSLDNEFLLIFNRLVDPEDVVSVTVNGIEYTR